MGYTFSPRVKEIISFSFEEASRLGNTAIRPEHLLLGIIRSKDNAACRLLERMHVNLEELRHEIELSLQSHSGYSKSLPLDKEAESVIKGAQAEAKILNTKRVEAEHIILAILNNDSFASQIISHIDK